jgi:hypothetical protein
MITFDELDHALTKAKAQTRARPSFTAAQDLREALAMAVRALAEDIESDTPTKREARRKLWIETMTLLSEVDAAVHEPSEANRTCVDHRLAVWTELLQEVRRTLGIKAGPDLGRGQTSAPDVTDMKGG